MSETQPGPVDWEQRFRDDDAPWERGRTHPALGDWIEAGVVRPGLSVIVPGCGRGPEPEILARLGLDVTALDIAPSAVAFQRARFEAAELPGRILEVDGLEWSPETPADLVYEQTFLCAISPKRRADYERAVHAWLKPGGRLLALFMQKAERGGPPYGCAPDAMRELFPAERWAWPEGALTPYPHPNGMSELAGVLVRL